MAEPDWQALVRRRLPSLGLRPEAEGAVVEELAAMLEDAWASEPRTDHGATDMLSAEAQEAWVAQQIPDTQALTAAIRTHAPAAARSRLDAPLGSTLPARPAARGTTRDRQPDSRQQDNSGERRRFGGFMSGWLHDVRLAFRLLVREPLFTLLAVLTLAVGIGLNSAVFSVVNAMLFSPLPAADPERLVRVYSQQPGGFLAHGPVSTLDYRDLAELPEVFSSVAAASTTMLVFEHAERSEMMVGELVSGSYFPTLGVSAVAGRLFGEAEDRLGAAEQVVVLSHAAWQQQFEGAPDAVGQVVRVNGTPLTVIGIAPETFHGLTKGLTPTFWLPLGLAEPLRIRDTFGPAQGPADPTSERRRRWLMVTGRLAPGVSHERADAALASLGTRLAEAYPASNEGRTFVSFPANDVRIMPGVDQILTTASVVLMVLVGLVLLIACANVASMLLSRAADRRKEVATRLAMGASRTAIFRQLLAESSLLALLGAGGGLLLAMWSNRVLNAIELPLVVDLELGLAIDGRVLAFTCLVAAGTALIFGLVPAVDAGRTNLISALRDKASAGGGRGGGRMRKVLVVGQVAVSTMLLVSAGLTVRSLLNAHLLEPGFDPDGVAVATFAPQLQGYDGEQVKAFYDQLVTRLGSEPGVEHVGMASYLPLTFVRNTNGAVPSDRRETPIDDWPDLETASVDGAYFDAMGIAVRRGRVFGDRDTPDSPRVTVINETLAQRFWPGQDPIGRRLWVDPSEENALEVVGVVADGKYVTLGESPRPFYYAAMNQTRPARRVVVARTAADVPALVRTLRRSARELDPAIAISDLQSLRTATSSALILPRAGVAVFGLFGGLGLLLAAVGLYGLMAYSVSRRIHEIGIRMAMGARRAEILGMVVRGGMKLTVIGALVGLVAAALASRALTAILYGIEPTDWLTFVAVTFFLLTTALVATWLPARRAARLDPQDALRYE